MQMEAILHVDHTCTGLRDCSLLISLLFLAFQDLSIPFPNAAGPSQTQQVCQRGINVRALKPSMAPRLLQISPNFSSFLENLFGFWVLKRNLKDFSNWPVKSFKSNSLDEFLPFYTISACHGQLLNMLYRLYQSFPCYYSDDFWCFCSQGTAIVCDILWLQPSQTQAPTQHSSMNPFFLRLRSSKLQRYNCRGPNKRSPIAFLKREFGGFYLYSWPQLNSACGSTSTFMWVLSLGLHTCRSNKLPIVKCPSLIWRNCG